MQNEPNFRKSQMNVSNLITKNYEILDTWWKWEKQSQYKANQSQSKPIKANQSQYKANQTQYKPKTNPIKPN